MYAGLLLLHSFLRWVVLAVALVTLIRTSASASRQRAWEKPDDQFSVALLGLGHVMLILGLVLWLWLSPLTQVAMSQDQVFAGGTLTFFTVAHPVSMLVAIVLLHLGRVRLKKSPDTSARHAQWRRSVAVFLGLTLLAIPWPWLEWGRPLVRLP
jgi:hypothetical protein